MEHRSAHTVSTRPETPGAPPVWLAVAVIVVAGGAAVWWALELNAFMGTFWIVGTGCLSFVGSIMFVLDPGLAKTISRERSPKAHGAKGTRLILLACLVQLPPITWRVAEGDPLEREAKAYVEANHEAWRGVAGGADPVVVALDGPDVPRLLTVAELRTGRSVEGLWFEFDHQVYGARRYWVERDRWETVD